MNKNSLDFIASFFAESQSKMDALLTKRPLHLADLLDLAWYEIADLVEQLDCETLWRLWEEANRSATKLYEEHADAFATADTLSRLIFRNLKRKKCRRVGNKIG